ncbi:hypothetical protein ACIPYU_05620 [Paenarthrobacter nicotinovorans]|uniref:hypothetical protein n=1 Tax=Paenarthrobacter nicotinovorans TaxID=29320 RepID=UPI00382F7360
MDDIISFIMKFAPLLGSIAVPLVGLIIKLRNDRQDPAAVRSIKQHAKLHDALPEESRSSIKELLDFETAQYAKKVKRRGSRKLNGGNVAAFIFVALLTGALLYPLIAWALIWPWAFIFVGIIGALGGALLIVGGGQLFEYEDETAEPAAESNSSGK